LGNLGVLSSQEHEMAKKQTSEPDEQSLIAAANEGVKALQLFLESPLDLDAKEWRRRKKPAEEGARAEEISPARGEG
jgi:hypothetical protein